jgi:hypothetical protein
MAILYGYWLVYGVVEQFLAAGSDYFKHNDLCPPMDINEFPLLTLVVLVLVVTY